MPAPCRHVDPVVFAEAVDVETDPLGLDDLVDHVAKTLAVGDGHTGACVLVRLGEARHPEFESGCSADEGIHSMALTQVYQSNRGYAGAIPGPGNWSAATTRPVKRRRQRR